MPLYVYGCPECAIELEELRSAWRADVTLGEPWGKEPPRTQLVFLRTPGGLDEVTLQAAFNRCRTELSLEQAVAAQQTWMRG